MKIRKRHNKKVHRHERKSLFLLQSDYNRITIGLQSGYNRLHHRLHLRSTQYKQFLNIYKKKETIKRKDKKKKKENEMEINGRRPERWESRRRKQKKGEKKRGGEREGKEKGGKEEKTKRDGRSLCRRKGKKKKGEREREKERKRRRGALPSADAFPSMKLGNNITPMKGRLRKNTTPTSGSPTELNQNLQNNPQQRRPDFDASSCINFSYAPEVSKYKFYNKGATIYKKAETLINSRSRSKFSINQH